MLGIICVVCVTPSHPHYNTPQQKVGTIKKTIKYKCYNSVQYYDIATTNTTTNNNEEKKKKKKKEAERS